MKKYGLIGFPLTHSFSKKYFSKKFDTESISNVTYELFPIENIGFLPDLLNAEPMLHGLNEHPVGRECEELRIRLCGAGIMQRCALPI